MIFGGEHLVAHCYGPTRNDDHSVVTSGSSIRYVIHPIGDGTTNIDAFI